MSFRFHGYYFLDQKYYNKGPSVKKLLPKGILLLLNGKKAGNRKKGDYLNFVTSFFPVPASFLLAVVY
ncbi:MAG TPA: hypothetical protein DIT10_10755 [Chryseobacterium sp.]|nr:hypothetical protein [Chryseobacterium sp.]